jgi:hypothetical protein
MLHPKRLPRVDVARAGISLIQFTVCKRNYSEQLQQRQLLMLLATAALRLRISEIQQSHVSWLQARWKNRNSVRFSVCVTAVYVFTLSPPPAHH